MAMLASRAESTWYPNPKVCSVVPGGGGEVASRRVSASIVPLAGWMLG